MTFASARQLLVMAITQPEQLVALSNQEWTRLVYFGRTSILLARIAADVRRVGVFDELPIYIQRHLIAAERQTALSQVRITWEIDRLKRAFLGHNQKIVLLKGAAYMATEMPCALGRPSSDIDVLADKDDLISIEATLMAAGFEPMMTSNYDQEYYRNWMHELPPLKHKDRQTMIDVHHTILPLTSRLKPDAGKLLADAVPVEGELYRLSDTDILLHSAVHLFQDGEVQGAFRDLVDQRDMILDFSSRNPNYWSELLSRAEELGLGRPLYYSLRYSERILGLKVPDDVRSRFAALGPVQPILWLMDALVERALFPKFIFDTSVAREIAGFLLYLRSHWLRMPPLMLARHLMTKAFKRFGAAAA